LNKALVNSIKKKLVPFVGEFNTDGLRQKAAKIVNTLLNPYKCYAFLVCCDRYNNTQKTIDKNYLIVDVCIKKTCSAKYIRTRFTLMPNKKPFTWKVSIT
jgi:hypothetical protein